MRRIVPYPLMTVALALMWMVLAGFTVGHLVVGTLVALVAGLGTAALAPERPKVKSWSKLVKLMGIVVYDILRSNLAVAWLIIQPRASGRRSGFMSVPLDMTDRTGLAMMAVIITATPGTFWLDYNSSKRTVLIHVFDLVDEEGWSEQLKARYETLLMEIFE